MFSLNCSKNRFPLKEITVLYEVNDKEILPYITQLSIQSPYQISMLAYIAEYIVRKWEWSLDCEFCFCVLELDFHQSPNYTFDFLVLKNQGGLVFSSNDVPRSLKAIESIIKEVVVHGAYDSPNISIEKSKLLILKNKTIRILSKNLFSDPKCDLKNEIQNTCITLNLERKFCKSFSNCVFFVMGNIIGRWLSTRKNVNYDRNWMNETVLFSKRVTCYCLYVMSR